MSIYGVGRMLRCADESAGYCNHCTLPIYGLVAFCTVVKGDVFRDCIEYTCEYCKALFHYE